MLLEVPQSKKAETVTICLIHLRKTTESRNYITLFLNNSLWLVTIFAKVQTTKENLKKIRFTISA